jgi:hypothetical protein
MIKQYKVQLKFVPTAARTHPMQSSGIKQAANKCKTQAQCMYVAFKQRQKFIRH